VALNRYVVTVTSTVPAGTAATPAAGEPGTGGAAGYGSAPTTGGPPWPVTYRKNQVLVLDPAGPLYAAVTAAGGSLRAFTDGTDTAGHQALAN
jgi:hypothetical protein